jgi:protein-tyrosine phosphatase
VVRSARAGEEFDQLDEHLAKISDYINLNVKKNPTSVVKKQEDVIEPRTQSHNNENKPDHISTDKSVIVDGDDDEIQVPELDSSVVVGSTRSTSSVIPVGTDETTITTKPTSSQSNFMTDLLNTPDSPVTPDAPVPKTTPTLSVNVSITPSQTDSASVTPQVRQIQVNTNPCETPSGRKAQERAQYGSLKRSINRPTQHGKQNTTLGSQGQNKLRTFKRNQLETLIKKAQVAAIVSEVDGKSGSALDDSIDIGSLLVQSNGEVVADETAVAAPSRPTPASIDEDSVMSIDTEPTQAEVFTPTSTSSSYPTHNITISGRYTLVDLFNCLWSKSSPLIIDTRDTIRFNISHVPFAIHIPITPEDIDFEQNSLKVSLGSLAARIPNANDQRVWRMRKGRSIVIVGQGPYDQDITAKNDVNIEELLKQGGQKEECGVGSKQSDEDKTTTILHNNTVAEIVNEYDTSPHFVPTLFASACIQENLANSVDIVPLGAAAFVERYPFLICSSMNSRHSTISLPKLQEKDQKHNHIPRFPAYPNEIIDQCVYLGSQADAQQRVQMEKLGITHIINATADLENNFESQNIEITDEATGRIVKQPLFRYLRLPMNDTHDQPLLEQLNKAFEFIDNALAGETLAGLNTVLGTPGKVLIHCQMGISRSASIVVAYIMRSFHCDLYNALAMVKSRRTQILPNPQFVKELANFECLLFGYPFEKCSYNKCMDELYPNGIPTPK